MSVLILGAGGHGKIVADILHCHAVPILGFLDDNPALWGTQPLGIPVLGPIDGYLDHAPSGLLLGIGSNHVRHAIVTRLGSGADHLWINAIHPTATISAHVRLGRGVAVVAQAVINVDSTVGDHVILNTAATVDHDCSVESFSHLAPGVHLAGDVTISRGVFVGIGAVVLPGRRIGDWATIGAGATVVHDIPAHVTAVGTPARVLPKRESSLS